MTIFGWLRRNHARQNGALLEWRARWAAAIETADPSSTADDHLRRLLDELGASEPDLEIEREMLDALEALRRAQPDLAGGSLPIVETRHRVIGQDACHFTAPASLPSDQSQPAGRVLLTGARAVFVGGGRSSATPWHAVRTIARRERDVLLVRTAESAAAHFRFNTYTDAVLCALLARHLAEPARSKR